MAVRLSAYYRKKFGCKVYKLSIDAGFTCPNRDGTLGTGGCIFCGADGGSAFAAKGGSITAQLEKLGIKDAATFFQNPARYHGLAAEKSRRLAKKYAELMK